jgi:hypothetical protein
MTWWYRDAQIRSSLDYVLGPLKCYPNGMVRKTSHYTAPALTGVVGTIILNLIGRKIICRNCGQGTFHDANDPFASTCFLVVITCFPVNHEYTIRFCFIMFCWLL